MVPMMVASAAEVKATIRLVLQGVQHQRVAGDLRVPFDREALEVGGAESRS